MFGQRWKYEFVNDLPELNNAAKACNYYATQVKCFKFRYQFDNMLVMYFGSGYILSIF